MVILALNCGSSSVKYKLFDRTKKEVIGEGVVERIGEGEHPDHKTALKAILKDLPKISAVGHRVVHGGEKFKKSVLITDKVLKAIRDLSDLAPLHNPPNIIGIEAAMEVLPKVSHVAVFDTAFHQTMPEEAYLYAVPYEWYEKYGVRRYGFHGSSHQYVSRRAAEFLGKKPNEVNLITLHIGNGVSITAIKKGKSVSTSMGLTPLEGAVMGTRCGDIDPAVILFMIEKEGFTAEQLDQILNKKSGLLGITGKYVDRRDIDKAAEAGDERCQLARTIEASRLKKYIGAYIAVLGQVDAIVFTAGAGEKNWQLRERVCVDMDALGLKLDRDKNAAVRAPRAEKEVSSNDSPIKILVIPTDEESVFVEEVVKVISEAK
ncbi:MAG: acetate kinase [bacterium]